MMMSESYDGQLPPMTDLLDGSTSSWNALYCSHLWANSNLRRAVINSTPDADVIKYCYTCRGKIRKYEVKSPKDIFVPNRHSTPNGNLTLKKELEVPLRELRDNSNHHSILPNDRSPVEGIDAEPHQCIPSISRNIDSSFRHKFTSYEMRPNQINRQRLRKSLKGIGCIVNFALTDSPVKKRTQIQACSISVMIVAIVVISFVLVNFTNPSYTRATNVASTIVVPTVSIDSNETSSVVTKENIRVPITSNTSTLANEIELDGASTTDPPTTTEQISLITNIIAKIRSNIRTFPKDLKMHGSQIPKDIINRDLSQRFCSCQTDEVCMLDENSGTAICREIVDPEDPTGCGGLCALETEACQLVDRSRGVRVCRLLSLVTCATHEWRCRNALCVPASARCDGSIQCYDRSDEMHCECDLTREFRCGHSISCFPNTKLCDGIIDCWDGFDELNCTTECPQDEFTCTDGQCIPPSRFCDGLADCVDGSDEPHGCGGECGTHEIRCQNQRCVSRALQCDGHDDCGDNSDETNCS